LHPCFTTALLTALKEPMTATFWIAMLLVVTGVVLGQTNWQKILGARWLPQE
jgi:drug/metabolite transporter (DMT)-like permease